MSGAEIIKNKCIKDKKNSSGNILPYSKDTGNRKKSVIKNQKQKKKSFCPLNPGKPKTFDNLDF